STTFTKETHLSIDLPEASGEPSRVVEEQIEITVTRSGSYAINDEPLVDKKLDTLKRAIQKVSEGDSSIPMTITADSRAPHQAVVTAMDAAGQLGYVQLSITTRNADDDDAT
ncbi:MAG: biopolymer transporter ExbD, partial [Pseudomonadales bacterium]|nr:biopolymer transporter ExbD [Pseudomonadales bacterium]